MSYINPYEAEGEASSNYLVRHWRGQNSLPFSYWINGSAITIGLGLLVSFLLSAIEASAASLRLFAAFGLFSILLLSGVWVWSAVGIWRSATRHPHRGGSGGWAAVAKIMVAIGCLASLGRLPNLYLQTRELGLLAAGSDPIGKDASLTIREDGALEVNGYFTQGFAARFAKALQSNPNVETLVLTSAGGRIREAEQMARLIKESGLDTVAEGECASACAIPFLAGESRLLGVEGRIGFHQPSFPGESRAEHQEGVTAFKNSLLGAGVEPSFAQQAMTAAPDDMWYPSAPRLIEARVLTGLHRSAVVADNAESAKGINAAGSRRVDNITMLTGAAADGTKLKYLYALTVPASQLDLRRLKRLMPPSVKADVCGNADQSLIIRSGATYTFSYSDSRGVPLMQFDVSDC